MKVLEDLDGPATLKGDAWDTLNAYRLADADPCTLIDSHRLFAVDLLCDGLVTGDQVRESVLSLNKALNYLTGQRKAQQINTILSEGV